MPGFLLSTVWIREGYPMTRRRGADGRIAWLAGTCEALERYDLSQYGNERFNVARTWRSSARLEPEKRPGVSSRHSVRYGHGSPDCWILATVTKSSARRRLSPCQR